MTGVRIKATPLEIASLQRATKKVKTGFSPSWSGLTNMSCRRNVESKMIGLDIPNYHKRKSKGDLLPYTPFFQYFIYPVRNTYNYSASRDDGYNYTGVTGMNSSSPATEFGDVNLNESSAQPYIDDVDYYSFVQDAVGRIGSKGHDSLTSLAELGKTAAMFTNVRKNLGKLVTDPRNRTRNLANLWLEGRYGWRTLRYDLIDLDDAVRNFDAKRTRYTERAGTSYTKTESTTSHASMSAGTYDVITEVTLEYSVRGMVTADYKPERFRTNVAVTAWELVPFSFVLDWFIDIGSSIEAMTFLAFTSSYAAAGGIQLDITRREYSTNNVKDPSYTSWQFSRDTVERGTYQFRMPVGVSIKPATRVKLDPYKLLDLLALVYQQVDKRHDRKAYQPQIRKLTSLLKRR
jgi:hypothetical protein